MRAAMRGWSALALALAAAGCSWSEFDDLQADTWVTSTGKPDTQASNWGVAITRVSRSGTGAATLGVLGASDPVYANVTISPDGAVSVAPEIPIGQMFATGSLAAAPLLLSSPVADEAALVTGAPDGRVMILRAAGGQVSQIVVGGTTLQPSAATYMVQGQASAQILFAQGDKVFGQALGNPPATPSQCKLTELTSTVDVRALGAYRPAGQQVDNFLVLSADGTLRLYSGQMFNSCLFTSIMALKGVSTGFMSVAAGSQILTFEDGDDRYAVVQAHDNGEQAYLQLFKITTTPTPSLTAIVPPRTDLGIKVAAILQPDPPSGPRFLVAGSPSATVDGVAAGQVQVFELSLTMGIGSPRMTLHDARPQAGQAFGRSVAALPFNGKQILAVAAANDIFVYFRTVLYQDTRPGR